MISNLVINCLTFSPGSHETRLLEQTEMLGYVLQSTTGAGGNFVHGQFLFREQPEDEQSAGISNYSTQGGLPLSEINYSSIHVLR